MKKEMEVNLQIKGYLDEIVAHQSGNTASPFCLPGDRRALQVRGWWKRNTAKVLKLLEI